MIRRIGDRLILVGVAHILPESIDEVKNSIRGEEPDIIGVELCQSRYMNLMRGGQDRDVSLGFSKRAILAKILEFIQKKMGERTGMMPGEEMITAVNEAEEIGSEVSLIDRDIGVTLQRLLDKMSLWEKIVVFGKVMLSLVHGEEFEIKDLNDEEVIERLIEVFRDTSETMYEVFLEERNDYMADRIVELLNYRPGKVLCVVGAGHIPGLSAEIQERFEEGLVYDWSTNSEI